MLKVGIISPQSKIGKTTCGIGLADAWVGFGQNVLFLNFDVENETELSPLIDAPSFTQYINKKVSLSKIIEKIHALNFDLISFYESDHEWFKKVQFKGIETIFGSLLNELEKNKKYDYCVLDLNPKAVSINEALFKMIDFLIIPIHVASYDLKVATALSRYCKAIEAVPTLVDKRFRLLTTMYDPKSISQNKMLSQIQIGFKEVLLTKHIPIFHERTLEIIENKRKSNLFSIIKELRPIFNNIALELKKVIKPIKREASPPPVIKTKQIE
ncbi:ParA family protein [[Mycoplasma] testudinis]|uniref:ParA family protein n=1 Tax=[Mycoplasma] testudinis TaxID=33924 RepID=UPI00047F7D14|nr:AAA family ATPase [[Mycoplasma] testudinis]